MSTRDLRRIAWFLTLSLSWWGIWWLLNNNTYFFVPLSETLAWVVVLALYLICSVHAIPSSFARPVRWFGIVVMTLGAGPKIIPLGFFQTDDADISLRDRQTEVPIEGAQTPDGIPIQTNARSVWWIENPRRSLLRAEDLVALVNGTVQRYAFDHIQHNVYANIKEKFPENKWKELGEDLWRWGVRIRSLNFTETLITDKSIAESVAQKVAMENLALAEGALMEKLQGLAKMHSIPLLEYRKIVLASTLGNSGNATVIPTDIFGINQSQNKATSEK